MKRFFYLLAILALTAVSCKEQAPKLTALMGGPFPEPQCIVVEYPTAIAAESVTPDAFTVADKEVAFVFVSDKNPAEAFACDKEKKPCDKEKPCAEPKECKDKKPCCEEKKPCCEEECCEGKPCAEGKECGKENCKEKDCCEKMECADKPCKHHGPRPECAPKEPVNGNFVILVLKGQFPCPPGGPRPEMEGCPDGKPCPPDMKPCPDGKPCPPDMKECPDGKPCPEMKECPEPPACPDSLACPEKPEINLSVQQVKDLKAVCGKTVKAWKAALPVTEFACGRQPLMGHRHGGPGHHHHGPHGCKPDAPEAAPAPQE